MFSNKVPRNGNLKMCIRKRVRYGYMYACKLYNSTKEKKQHTIVKYRDTRMQVQRRIIRKVLYFSGAQSTKQKRFMNQFQCVISLFSLIRRRYFPVSKLKGLKIIRFSRNIVWHSFELNQMQFNAYASYCIQYCMICVKTEQLVQCFQIFCDR